MAIVSLLATQLLIKVSAIPISPELPGVINTNLRGSEIAAAPAFVDERGDRGHFFYADACDDCFYKGAQCGCTPTLEYFACLTKHCYSANRTRFTEKCDHLGRRCSSELNIDCNGPSTTCTGKFNQLPAGGIGLTMNMDDIEDDAFCGPHGKCIGAVHMKVDIHRQAQQLLPALVAPPSAAGAPAPAVAASPFPAPAPATAPVWLECGLPNVTNARVDDQTHWILCKAQAQGDSAGCDVPMFPSLDASAGKQAYCVLTDGSDGNPPRRLTEPAWFTIRNSHEKSGQRTQCMAHTMIWAVAALLAMKDM